MTSPTDRDRQRKILYRGLHRTTLFHAGVIGFLAGLIAVVYQIAVRNAEDWSRLVASWSDRMGLAGVVAAILCAGAFGAAIAGLIARYAPDAGGSGIPHIKAALLRLRLIRPLHLIISKFLGGLAALAVGMSMGREGPTIQMGAAVGKLYGDTIRAPQRARSTLIAAGAGAGLAAAFNAPLAGFLFVMEELKREMSSLTYGAALAASVIAVGTTRFLVGERPSFVLPSPGPVPLIALPFTAILGLLAGLAGVLFNQFLMRGLEARRKLRIPAVGVGALAGVMGSSALFFLPEVAGGGHYVAESLLSGGMAKASVVAILALFFAKLVLTTVSYVTGLPGGIFAPILVMGAFVGYAFGVVAHQVWPGLPFSPEGFATIGMAAMLSASVRAPLTGVVLIVEMTNEYGLLYALLISAFIASLAAQALKDEPIYEALMERDLRLSGAEVHPSEETIQIEFQVEPNSKMDGRRIKHLGLPAGAILITLERGARHIVPGGSTMVVAGDMVTVLIDGSSPELSQVIHEQAKAPS